MKILCLLDFNVGSGRWLWDYLPNVDDEVDFLTAVSNKDRYAKWGKLIAYYPPFWRLGWRAVQQVAEKKYDVIMAWEGKNGFPYAVLSRLFGKKSPRLVIAAFNYRGVLRDFHSLAKFGMDAVDHISVITQFEVTYYQKLFGFAEDQVSFIPLGWYRIPQEEKSSFVYSEEPFILASGRSYRDYATLFEAVDGLPIRLKVIARPFNIARLKIPANVICTDLLPMNEFWKELRHCRFLVVPLEPVPHSAGEGHFVQAMSADKAIIATRTYGSESYISDGVTGILVPPKDPESMRKAILRLWEDPNEAKLMGKCGRFKYERYYTMEKFSELTRNMLSNVFQ